MNSPDVSDGFNTINRLSHHFHTGLMGEHFATPRSPGTCPAENMVAQFMISKKLLRKHGYTMLYNDLSDGIA